MLVRSVCMSDCILDDPLPHEEPMELYLLMRSLYVVGQVRVCAASRLSYWRHWVHFTWSSSENFSWQYQFREFEYTRGSLSWYYWFVCVFVSWGLWSTLCVGSGGSTVYCRVLDLQQISSLLICIAFQDLSALSFILGQNTRLDSTYHIIPC